MTTLGIIGAVVFWKLWWTIHTEDGGLVKGRMFDYE